MMSYYECWLHYTHFHKSFDDLNKGKCQTKAAYSDNVDYRKTD